MRVQANKDITFFYEMVPYTVTAGQVVDGPGARHLLDTGADVTTLDEDPVAGPEQAAADVELDVSAKIADVLAWVGTDEARALEAHAAEAAKDKPRPRLLAQLEEIAAGSSPTQDGDDSDDDEADSTED